MENKLESQQVGENVEVLKEPWLADGYWHVPVRWGNGKVTVTNFPEAGLPVFDQNGGSDKLLATIPSKEVIEFLNKHSKEYKYFDQLNWSDYLKGR